MTTTVAESIAAAAARLAEDTRTMDTQLALMTELAERAATGTEQAELERLYAASLQMVARYDQELAMLQKIIAARRDLLYHEWALFSGKLDGRLPISDAIERGRRWPLPARGTLRVSRATFFGKPPA